MNPTIMSRFGSRRDFYSRLGLFLLLVVGVAGLFVLPFSITGDGTIRYQFMDTLVHHLRIDPMKYSIIGPLFSLPLWIISLSLKDPSAIISRYNLLLYAGSAFVLYQWLKHYFDRKFLITFLFILSFGSMFPWHLIRYNGEVFSSVCLTLGTAGLAIKKDRFGWACLILAVLNSPALLVPFVLVALYFTWETRQIRYLFLIPVCMILMFLESYLRTGSFLTGFQTYLNDDHGFKTVLPFSGLIGYSYPFVLGVLSILFSFGKGLIFFCPGLILIGWVRKSISNPVERKLLILWLLVVLGMILAYASWWAWYGGWSWGPRFFLFASLPASWILARLIHSDHKSLSLSLVLPWFMTLALWIGVNGLVFQLDTLNVCQKNDYALEFLCWYVPEFSPLIRPFIVRTALLPKDWLMLIIFAGLWLYIMIPLLIDLFRQLKVVYHANRFLLKVSTWRL
jgi:hypothetical protein